MLNPQSPIPLYRQLSDLLREGIRSGEYPAGTRVPSEHRLAEQYEIGRPTVRQAIDVLVREQLLSRKRGSGTFVRKESGEVDLFSLAGTIASFHKKGLDVTTRILNKIKRKRITGRTENPFSGKEAFFFLALVSGGRLSGAHRGSVPGSESVQRLRRFRHGRPEPVTNRGRTVLPETHPR